MRKRRGQRIQRNGKDITHVGEQTLQCSVCRKHFLDACFRKSSKNKRRRGRTHRCKDCDLVKNKEAQKRDTARFKWRGFKGTSKQRGIKNSLTFLEYSKLLSITHCEICGKRLRLVTTTRGDNRDAWSIDRIDNRKGYESGNVGVLCRLCNLKKKDLTRQELLQMVAYIDKERTPIPEQSATQVIIVSWSSGPSRFSGPRPFREIVIRHDGVLGAISKELGICPSTISRRLWSEPYASWWKEFKQLRSKRRRATRQRKWRAGAGLKARDL